jgi:hypothetical protein
MTSTDSYALYRERICEDPEDDKPHVTPYLTPLHGIFFFSGQLSNNTHTMPPRKQWMYVK